MQYYIFNSNTKMITSTTKRIVITFFNRVAAIAAQGGGMNTNSRYLVFSFISAGSCNHTHDKVLVITFEEHPSEPVSHESGQSNRMAI